MPLLETKGAASAQGFGFTLGAAPVYIEDVFSTYLYTGNGSTQTITNGIDLVGKGGLVWRKLRSAAGDHILEDTVRGAGNYLLSNATNAQANSSTLITSFNTTGFTTGAGSNANGSTYASWTFREQPKFFDVVTYTGDGTTSRNIPHSLGSTPGCIIVKATNANDDWYVYHRGCSTNNVLYLNLTNAQTSSTMFGTPTSTDFVVTTGGAALNVNGRQYVAYLFAHNAGGFGLTGTDNVISCGSFTTDGSGNATVNLGYEPQFLSFKASSASGNWFAVDSMRGFGVLGSTIGTLFPNLSDAENTATQTGYLEANATGFRLAGNAASTTHIYIAIRRGPMKVPTTGTSVYTSASRTGTAGVIPRWVAGFPVDMGLRQSNVTAGGSDWQLGDRLRGAVQIKPNLTEAEEAQSVFTFDSMTGWSNLGAAGNNTSDRTWMFQRAPGFFDEVCYTGTGTAGQTFAHNLGAVPELMIVKKRSSTGFWIVYSQTLGIGNYLILNDAGGANASGLWGGVAPTASVFTLGTNANINEAGSTFVWYGFASCPGVSKVGSYTGTGTTQTINCGFAAGSRFVLIKRVDPAGVGQDWYVWDSARGIVAGNDPYLLLNSTAAEVTNTDFVDTASTGFEISSTAPAAINANGGSFIFLAIA
jgi:hypothetical protein